MKRFFQLYVNDTLVKESDNVWSICERAELFAVNGWIVRVVAAYQGEKYDPVLHSPIVFMEWNQPPCPKRGCCEWQKTPQEPKPRPTSLRIESMPESNRCGFMLKPGNYTGNSFYDFAHCRRG